MSRYPGHDPPHDPSSFSVDPYGAPTTYYDQQGVDLISKSSTDEKKDYYEEEVVEKPEVKVSRLDKFAGQTKSWGDLSNIDPEVVERVFDQDRVREAFTSRQLAMIALSGSVGVGIWLGVGKALAKAGPLSLLLGYLIVGVFACSMLFCQAELSSLAPVSGYYVRHSGMFVSQAVAFSSGWSGLYGTFVGLPGELTAGAALASSINPNLNVSIYITILGVAILTTSLFFTRIYAETEYTFSVIKLLTAIGLVIFCICVDLGAGPTGHRTGFQYWRNPGPMAEYLVGGVTGRWFGFWYTLTNAAYSYQGIETICAAGSETKNPRQALPRAAKRVFARVGLLYISLVFCVGLVVPYNDKRLVTASGTSSSPFIVAARNAGVKVLPTILSVIMVTSAWSSGASGVLSSSRTAMALARMGFAPKVFLKTHRWGVPWVAVLVVTCGFPLAYTAVSSSASQVFSYFQSVVSSLALWQWTVTCFISLRVQAAMKKQGIERSELPWKAFGQPYFAWIGLCGSFFCLFTGGFTFFVPGDHEPQTFISAYACPVINICLLVGYKLYTKTPFLIPLEEVPIRPWLIQHRQNPEVQEPRPRGLIQIISWIWI